MNTKSELICSVCNVVEPGTFTLYRGCHVLFHYSSEGELPLVLVHIVVKNA